MIKIKLNFINSNECLTKKLTKVPIHEKIEWVLFVLLVLVEDCIHEAIVEQNSEQAIERINNTIEAEIELSK